MQQGRFDEFFVLFTHVEKGEQDRNAWVGGCIPRRRILPDCQGKELIVLRDGVDFEHGRLQVHIRRQRFFGLYTNRPALRRLFPRLDQIN